MQRFPVRVIRRGDQKRRARGDDFVTKRPFRGELVVLVILDIHLWRRGELLDDQWVEHVVPVRVHEADIVKLEASPERGESPFTHAPDVIHRERFRVHALTLLLTAGRIGVDVERGGGEIEQVPEKGHKDGSKLIRQGCGETEERGETRSRDIRFARTRASPFDALQEEWKKLAFGALERERDARDDGFPFHRVERSFRRADGRIASNVERSQDETKELLPVRVRSLFRITRCGDDFEKCGARRGAIRAVVRQTRLPRLNQRANQKSQLNQHREFFAHGEREIVHGAHAALSISVLVLNRRHDGGMQRNFE